MRGCVKFRSILNEANRPIQLEMSFKQASTKTIAVLSKEHFTVMLNRFYWVVVKPFNRARTQCILSTEWTPTNRDSKFYINSDLSDILNIPFIFYNKTGMNLTSLISQPQVSIFKIHIPSWVDLGYRDTTK